MWMDDRTNVDVLVADHKYCAFTTYFNLMFSSTSSFHLYNMAIKIEDANS